ncbi:MAG TPA: LapA family protein [Clostridia bacterium]|nr:LapA family protein [Clostridia bacterium]
MSNNAKNQKGVLLLVQVYWVTALLFALMVAVFAVQNAETVNIRLLYWQFQDISLVLVILGSAAVGALLLFILGSIKQFSLMLRLKEAENKIRKLENQLKELQASTPPPQAEESKQSQPGDMTSQSLL